jgi:hypothetical protein
MFVDFREGKFCAKPDGAASVKGSIAMTDRAFAIAKEPLQKPAAVIV